MSEEKSAEGGAVCLNGLLPCPFCGKSGETLMIDAAGKPFIYHCSNPQCQLHKVQFRIDQWNSRYELMDLSKWIENERANLPPGDGYDYYSGVEFGMRRIFIEVEAMRKAG